MEQEGGEGTGARVLVVMAAVVVVIAGLKAAAGLLLPFVIALFLALISLPLLNWLQHLKVPKWLAVTATILVAVSMLLGLAVLLGRSVREFTTQAVEYKERLQELTTRVQNWLAARNIRVPENLTTDLVNPGQAVEFLTGTLYGVASVLSNLVLVFLAVIFILAEAADFPAKFAAAFGRGGTTERFGRIQGEVQRYLGIKTLMALITGATVAIGTAIIGLDFALLWGVLAFLLNYVPAFGSLLAAIPPVLLALVTLGLGRAFAVALVFLAVNLVLDNFVEPHMMGRKLGLSALVVYISLAFWGWVWGPVGMLLSVPLTMVLKIMLENTPDLRWIAVLLDAAPPADGTRKAARRRAS